MISKPKFWLLALALLASPSLAQGTGEVQKIAASPYLGLHHVSLTVSDIDATVAFYRHAMPFPIIRRFQIKASQFPAQLVPRRSGKVDVALIETPTGFIQLLDFDPQQPAAANPKPVIGPGYTHICFQSAATDPAIHRLRWAGLSVISRLDRADGVDIGGYGVRYAYGRDPDGIMIELEALDQPKRREAAWMTHIANVVHDSALMCAFYSQLLGRPAHRNLEQQNNAKLDAVANIDNLAIRGSWFTFGNMDLELWHFRQPQTPAPSHDRTLDEIGYNSFALEVVDLAAERRRLENLAVRLAGSPIEMGGWLVQYAFDPEGNLFAVQQRTTAKERESLTALVPPAL